VAVYSGGMRRRREMKSEWKHCGDTDDGDY
jgi:hypothetical protein